jgi:DNA-binding transcriptional LysR family regulator
MAFADASLVPLRVFREVAERGTLTAAAAALGYTQSAVSRQIAALERAAGTPLLERRHSGVRLTPAGRIVLRRAAAAIDEVDAAARELAGLPGQTGTLPRGWFTSPRGAQQPRPLAAQHPTDLALLASAPPFRPPDTETPPLRLQILTERSLHIAVPATNPLARGEFADVADLHGQRWIAGEGDDRVMGVWPGLDERPDIAHTARDWLAKLHLVAAGCGITTVPAALAPVVPPGVRILPVRGGPAEQRRILLARLPQPLAEPAARLADALRAAAIETEAPM